MDNLLDDAQLEWSSVVANNAMNRERKATGVNSYEKDIRLNPIAWLETKKNQNRTEWIDLCCGRGNALIEVAQKLQNTNWGQQTHLTGLDLVNHFADATDLPNLILQPFNLHQWNPKVATYDLITIVHGLHYIGDKLGLIFKCAAALRENGLFIGNLDLKNIQIQDVKDAEKRLKAFFKKEQMDWNAKTKIIKIVGQRTIQNPFIYCGANDKAGPNYTGQPVVDSIYRNEL
jgi:SAM-dependent methyltransferase